MSVWYWTKLPKGNHRFWEKKDGWYGLKYKEKWIIDYCENGDPYADDITHYAGPIPRPKKKPQVDMDTIINIIVYLNNATGQSFKTTSSQTRRLIQARFNEGFTGNDFLKVIDNRCKKWLADPKMMEYLRPSTLFSNKFEGYLQNGSNSPPRKQKPTIPNYDLYEAETVLKGQGPEQFYVYAREHKMSCDDVDLVLCKIQREKESKTVDQLVGRIGG